MRMVLFGNCCFQVILTACSLHVYRLSTRVMMHVSLCVHNMHAGSSADSFAVGSGVWSVFVMFSLAYFGTQSRISFPAKRYFGGLTAKYFSRENICVYGSLLSSICRKHQWHWHSELKCLDVAFCAREERIFETTAQFLREVLLWLLARLFATITEVTLIIIH
jgi:hypothetical protein